MPTISGPGRVVRGALAGALATGAMTLVQLAATRRRGADEPMPEKVVEGAAARAGLHLEEPTEDAVSTAAHLAYGMTAHTALALASPSPGMVTALLFSLALGVLGYQGWIPAAGLLPRLSAMDTTRQVDVVASHAVYGVALWLALRLLGSGEAE